MCKIYKNPPTIKTSILEFENMFKKPEFKDLVEVSMTGGEPLMDLRRITEIMNILISELPKLEWVFVNTNGTYPDRVDNFIKMFAGKVPKLTISISLEGERDVHNLIRGVKSFDLVMETIKIVAKNLSNNVTGSISTTLTKYNASVTQLDFVRKVAEEYGFDNTFRFAGTSGTYYHNTEEKLGIENIPKEKISEILDFINKYYKEDPFQQIQSKYIKSGKIGLTCTAGSDFGFVQADGNIYPCIFSTRVIGDKYNGVTTHKIDDLGKYEPCPCCTECTIYPMINYGPKSNKTVIN
jgi:sulfatase maturation enzyme AslB (radical SAM superfamily)